MNPVKIPGGGVDSSAEDLMAPIMSVLRGISAIGGPSDSTGGVFSSPSTSSAAIETGATASTKWCSALLGAFGATITVVAAVTHLSFGERGASQVAYIAGTGFLLGAITLAIAIVVASDVRARAKAYSSIYHTRALISESVVSSSLVASMMQSRPDISLNVNLGTNPATRLQSREVKSSALSGDLLTSLTPTGSSLNGAEDALVHPWI